MRRNAAREVGLWERWMAADGTPLETVTLITTDANALVRPVHDRMPVILQPADYAAWLGAQTKAKDLKALLKPLPEDLMERYRVSRRMSIARNNLEFACQRYMALRPKKSAYLIR